MVPVSFPATIAIESAQSSLGTSWNEPGATAYDESATTIVIISYVAPTAEAPVTFPAQSESSKSVFPTTTKPSTPIQPQSTATTVGLLSPATELQQQQRLELWQPPLQSAEPILEQVVLQSTAPTTIIPARQQPDADGLQWKLKFHAAEQW